MEKNSTGRKAFVLFLTAAAVIGVAAAGVWFCRDNKETWEAVCTEEKIEDIRDRQNTGLENILIEMEYTTLVDGVYIFEHLYVFRDGNVYSGKYDVAEDETIAEMRRQYKEDKDSEYWEHIYDQCYWGRLSSDMLEEIMVEIESIEDYEFYENPMDTPQSDIGGTAGLETDVRYVGHAYYIYMEDGGRHRSVLTSTGSFYNRDGWVRDEHAQAAVNRIKGTWQYGHWGISIFGENWKDRIDIKD